MSYSEIISYKKIANIGQFEEVSLLYEPKTVVQEQLLYVEAEK